MIASVPCDHFLFYMKIEDEIKQATFRSPHQKLAINILFTSWWLVTQHKDFFKSFKITNQQFNILRILRGQGDRSISGMEIKKRMIDKNSDVSRLLDRLAVKKLIEKSQCPSDKRAADIKITEKGLALLKEIDPLIDKLEKSIWSLDANEIHQLSDLLDKCRGK